MREIKRRTDAVEIFPDAAAADRLVGAHLLERDETWQCSRGRYLNMDLLFITPGEETTDEAA